MKIIQIEPLYVNINNNVGSYGKTITQKTFKTEPFSFLIDHREDPWEKDRIKEQVDRYFENIKSQIKDLIDKEF